MARVYMTRLQTGRKDERALFDFLYDIGFRAESLSVAPAELFARRLFESPFGRTRFRRAAFRRSQSTTKSMIKGLRICLPCQHV